MGSSVAGATLIRQLSVLIGYQLMHRSLEHLEYVKRISYKTHKCREKRIKNGLSSGGGIQHQLNNQDF